MGVLDPGLICPSDGLDYIQTPGYFGHIELEVYFCPGHTPGHVVFLHRSSLLAQVGDVLFKGSIGRTDFPRGDQATLVHSIRNNLFPLGDDIKFIPGHGPMSTFGAERRSNPFVTLMSDLHIS